jgi:hypothetical protein
MGLRQEVEAGCQCKMDHDSLAREAVAKALAEMLPQAAKDAVDDALASVVERAVSSALVSLIAQFNAVTGRSVDASVTGNASQPQDGTASNQLGSGRDVEREQDGSRANTHTTVSTSDGSSRNNGAGQGQAATRGKD